MISAVMAYHNRFHLLDYTLKTMTESKYNGEIEVIVVDDFSDEKENVDNLVLTYPQLNVKIVKMSDITNRWYINPSVVYNQGFSRARGDKIVIQNPECCHIGDILSYVDEHCNDENYLSFHCWTTTRDELPLLHNDRENYLNSKESSDPSEMKWFNHREYRSASYHFTTAITRNNLSKLNGFDERFARGKCFDDDEFIFRIKKMGLNINFVDKPYSVHQWHQRYLQNMDAPSNRDLYRQIQKEYVDPKVNNDIQLIGEQ